MMNLDKLLNYSVYNFKTYSEIIFAALQQQI